MLFWGTESMKGLQIHHSELTKYAVINVIPAVFLTGATQPLIFSRAQESKSKFRVKQ